MAHMLEERDGKASFFQRMMAGVSLAWHGLGTYFKPEDSPKTVTEALETCRGNFDVEVRPNTFKGYTPDGDTFEVESNLSATIVRTDLNQEVGTASPDYVPMQYSDVFRPMQTFLDAGLAIIETAGVTFNGARMFMLFRWTKEQLSDLAQEAFRGMETYALLTASHSGKDGIGAYQTNVTVVCNNTETLAINSALTYYMTKHSKNAGVRFVDGISSLWGRILETNEQAAKDMLALRGLILDEIAFRSAVLDVIQPLPQNSPDFDVTSKKADYVVKVAEENREIIRSLWTNGLGHVGDFSAWEAYKAVTQFADNGDGLWKPRTPEARAYGLVKGPMATAKVQVFSSLLALTK
jgi:hypothetical protein